MLLHPSSRALALSSIPKSQTVNSSQCSDSFAQLLKWLGNDSALILETVKHLVEKGEIPFSTIQNFCSIVQQYEPGDLTPEDFKGQSRALVKLKLPQIQQQLKRTPLDGKSFAPRLQAASRLLRKMNKLTDSFLAKIVGCSRSAVQRSKKGSPRITGVKNY